MKVLTVGVDSTTAEFLNQNSVRIESADIQDTEELYDWLKDNLFQATIIDLDKSNLGVYISRYIRDKRIETPIVGVSRGHEEYSWSDYRAMFLENGGDDLIKGPANPRELSATLRAVTRRFNGSLLDIVEFQSEGITIKVNRTTRSIAVNGMEPWLTGKESDIFHAFASRPNRVLTKEMLMEEIYVPGIDDEPQMKIIDVFVCKLRNKLDNIEPGAGKMIETVWGRGYMMSTKNTESEQVA